MEFATVPSHVKIFSVNFLRVFQFYFAFGRHFLKILSPEFLHIFWRYQNMKVVPTALGMKFFGMAFRIALVAFHPVS